MIKKKKKINAAGWLSGALQLSGVEFLAPSARVRLRRFEDCVPTLKDQIVEAAAQPGLPGFRHGRGSGGFGYPGNRLGWGTRRFLELVGLKGKPRDTPCCRFFLWGGKGSDSSNTRRFGVWVLLLRAMALGKPKGNPCSRRVFNGQQLFAFIFHMTPRFAAPDPEQTENGVYPLDSGICDKPWNLGAGTKGIGRSWSLRLFDSPQQKFTPPAFVLQRALFSLLFPSPPPQTRCTYPVFVLFGKKKGRPHTSVGEASHDIWGMQEVGELWEIEPQNGSFREFESSRGTHWVWLKIKQEGLRRFKGSILAPVF